MASEAVGAHRGLVIPVAALGDKPRAEVYETVVRAAAPDEIGSSPHIPAVEGTMDFIEPFLVFQDLLFGEDSQMAGKATVDRPARCRRRPRRLDDLPESANIHSGIMTPPSDTTQPSRQGEQRRHCLPSTIGRFLSAGRART